MTRAGALREKVRVIFETFQRLNPHPTTELVYGNAYQLLVAVVLSAQATDKGVNKATAALFARVKTPAEMVALGEAGLTDYIRTIGLYRAKARNVMALSVELVRDHKGEVPRLREELEALPGVGRKTANVVLNTLYGEPVMAVDTHVFRVANRLGIAKGATPLAVEKGLDAVIPDQFKVHAHHWLILHGRYTCVARAPKCDTCAVRAWCDWYARQEAVAKKAGKVAAGGRQ